MKKIRISLMMVFTVISVYAQYFEDKATELGISTDTGYSFLGNGVSFFDFDNDGWDDITLTTELGMPLKFFKNVNGNFVEHDLNIADNIYQTRQINWVDFDNDGDSDLFVTSDTNGNRLYENNESVYSDITVSTGLPLANIKSYGASWGDYDNDGYLDVFLSTYDSDLIIPNYLYKNNGDGTFTNVSEEAGIINTSNLSFCSAFLDFNNDGWQDIYVSKDRSFHVNTMYRNNGDGTFTEVGEETGTNIAIDAMTVTVGDYNNDGWQDIYVSNSPDEGNFFFRNNGNGTFTDIATSSGTKFWGVGWGSVFLDADNDRDLDLYVSGSLNGASTFASAEFYENVGNDQFLLSDDDGFLNDNRKSHSNAIGDVDNDGQADILVGNNDYENIYLWKNETSTSNNWLKINLEGTTSNRDGIGSRIEVSINGESQYRYTHCGEGYLSQNSSSEFIGFGESTQADYVKVTWLSGIEDIIYNVDANQTISIVEGSTLSLSEFNRSIVNVYPNPFSSILNIINTTSISKLTVTNILGQQVYYKMNELSIDYLELNLSSLDPGVYFLTIEDDLASVQSMKLIKK